MFRPRVVGAVVALALCGSPAAFAHDGEDAAPPIKIIGDMISKDQVVPFTHEQLDELRKQIREQFPDQPQFRTFLDRMESFFTRHADKGLKQPMYPKTDVVFTRRVMGEVFFPSMRKMVGIMSGNKSPAEIKTLREELHQSSMKMMDTIWAEVAHDKAAKHSESDVVKLARRSVRCTMRPAACGAPDGASGSRPNGGSSSGPVPGGKEVPAPPDDLIQEITGAGAAELLAQHSGAELDQGQFANAHADAQSALRMDPTNQEALAVLHLSEGRGNGMSVDKFLAGDHKGGSSDEGGGTLSGGAANGLSGAGSARPPSDQAQKGIQNALGLNDMAGALSLADRALAQDPNNAALLNLRATVYARARDYDKAIADAEAGLAVAPRNQALRRVLGYAQLRGGKYKDALATAHDLIELDPRDAYAYALRAHAYGSMGDRDAMLSDLKRAAELDPRFARALAQAGALQLPSSSDILFLFPGEAAPGASGTAAAPASRGRRFGTLLVFSVLGGLLLALGLLHTLFASFREAAVRTFAQLTRTGPKIGAAGLAPSPERAGLIHGQYEISRAIGSGGMGMVFEGTDRALGRRVAIKKMRDELRSDARERDRFVAEARTVAALHHPNIVDIFAIADDGDDVYLIFEFIDGKTVHDLVQSRGRLAPEQTAKIIHASADALDYAHAHGVIHRDMKPSNMMLDRSGVVKVMDFGIARAAKDALTRRSLTNTIVGTPPYMAPEQEQGQVRRESDVYSLAVCAYEMLCGRTPFIGSNGGMLLNKINMSFVPPSRETPGLPSALDPVFLRAFQADPDQRWRAPLEFAGALDAALLVRA